MAILRPPARVYPPSFTFSRSPLGTIRHISRELLPKAVVVDYSFHDVPQALHLLRKVRRRLQFRHLSMF